MSTSGSIRFDNKQFPTNRRGDSLRHEGRPDAQDDLGARTSLAALGAALPRSDVPRLRLLKNILFQTMSVVDTTGPHMDSLEQSDTAFH